MLISVKNIHSQAVGLTQAHMIGAIASEPIRTSSELRHTPFTRALMSSSTEDHLVTIGDGTANPIKLTRLLLQHASRNNIPFTEVSKAFWDMIKTTGHSRADWASIGAMIMGTKSGTVRSNQISPIYPLQLLERLRLLNKDVPDVFIHVLCDIVIAKWAPHGWVAKDSAFTYRVTRTESFPTHQSLIDLVEAKNMLDGLTTLISVDFDNILRPVESEHKAALASVLANRMADAMLTGYDTIAARYNADQVVETVLTILGRVWNPNTADGVITPRIAKISHLSELTGNLTLFMIYQEMVSLNPVRELSYAEDELQIVFDVFTQALSELSDFKVRPLSEVKGPWGKRSTYNYQGIPHFMCLFEDWDFREGAEAFTTQRHAPKVPGRYISIDPHITSVLANALAPVQQTLSVSGLVRDAISVYDVAEPTVAEMAEGPVLKIISPSAVRFDLEYAHRSDNDDSATLEDVLRLGHKRDFIDDNSDDDEETDVLVSGGVIARANDYFKLIAHYAVARAQDEGVRVQVGEVTNEGLVMRSSACIPQLALSFSIDVPSSISLGSTSPYMGVVTTTEPLETIAYLSDHDASTALTYRGFQLSDHHDDLHLWDYESVSESLSSSFEYKCTLNGVTRTVDVEEHHVLGTGRTPKDTLFIRPIMAQAFGRIWVDNYFERLDYLESRVDIASDNEADTLLADSYRGKITASALNFTRAIQTMGSQGLGDKFASNVEFQLAQQMTSPSDRTHYRSLQRGVQRSRLLLWAGGSSLTLLGIVTIEDLNRIFTHLKDIDAFSYVISALAD